MIADVGVGFQPQVAAAVGGPVVALLREDRIDAAEDGVLVGKMPTTLVRRLINILGMRARAHTPFCAHPGTQGLPADA